MRIAVKTTLYVMLFYLVAVIAMGFWIERDLRATVEVLMEDTAALVGKQVAAALHEPVMDELLSGDRASSQRLTEMVETATERSATIASIDVIDSAGTVVSSDDDSLRGELRAAAEEIFADDRAPKLQSDFDRPFSVGRHTLWVPMLRTGKLIGYLQLELRNRPIAELYDKAYAHLLLAALLGLLIVVLLGVILQIQLSNLGKSLTAVLEAPIAGGRSSVQMVPVRKDEFAGVRDAAGRVGQELVRTRDRAKLTSEELDLLAKVVDVGVLILDAEGEPVLVSEATRGMLAGPSGDFSRYLAQMKRPLDEAMQRIRSGAISTHHFDRDVTVEGVPKRLRFELFALDAHDWKGCLILIKDRNMMDALEADLHTATRFRGMSRLYMGAAHDLKSPLNAIVMNLEMLKLSLQEDEAGNAQADDTRRRTRDRYLKVVTEELARLQRFLNALLEQTAPTRDERARIDLRELIQGLETLLAPQARQQVVTLIAETPPTPVHIMGYWGRVRQALLNILVNSLEAMPNKGELKIVLTEGKGEAHIAICDDGPGIPSSLSEKIFDMHFTTRNSGTGIGLYVTRGVIEQHGGAIEVRTELGKGTCFDVRLPLTDVTTSARDETGVSVDPAQ